MQAGTLPSCCTVQPANEDEGSGTRCQRSKNKFGVMRQSKHIPDPFFPIVASDVFLSP